MKKSSLQRRAHPLNLVVLPKLVRKALKILQQQPTQLKLTEFGDDGNVVIRPDSQSAVLAS